MQSKSMTYNPMIAHKRRNKDIMKLLMSDYQVTQSKSQINSFTVKFNGPKDSPYEKG